MKKELFLAMCLFGLCFAQAGTVNVVSPSDGLGYTFKEIGRGINLFVVDTFNDEAAQVEARLRIQEEYQLERAKEMSLGNSNKVAEIESKNVRATSEVSARIMKSTDPQVQARIQTALQNHQRVLEQVRAQVPEQARSGIDNAIQSSQQQQTQSQTATAAMNQTGTGTGGQPACMGANC